jgi:hypothetical protein
MAVSIITKDVRPEKGKGEDNAVIILARNQVDPYQARPEDFEILEDGEAEYVGHGQHGTSEAERRKIEKASASDHGKSPLGRK